MVSVDNRIMAACLREMADVSGHSGGEVVLVTKDGAMSIKAHGAGIPVEDYRNDKVSHEDARVTDTQTIDIRRPEAHQFGIDSEIYLSDGRSDSLNLNEYVILRDDKDGKEIPARYFGRGLFRTLIGQNGFSVSGGIHIKPRNIEQSFLVDALLDTSIDLVTISGPAGTGKTILSMAAGLHSVAGGRYTRLSITRPIIGVGNDIGFLPGNIEEKMTPWLQGYSDSADVLFTRAGAPQDKPQSERKAKAKNARENARKSNGTPARGSGDKGLLERAARIKPFNDLIARGILEVQAITHIRGRSIPDSILMLDEAQNTNAHQIKTVVTRMARNSKLILSGDPAQIDSPWVDARSNGLIHVRTRMRNLPNVAHVVLKSGERSPLAEMAARML
jgi:PhoH-like ATPase